MVKLKLYYKNKLGFTFYFGIVLALFMFGFGVYQVIQSQIIRAGIDFVLAGLISYTSFSSYKNRNKYKEQEVEVQKYEEIK